MGVTSGLVIDAPADRIFKHQRIIDWQFIAAAFCIMTNDDSSTSLDSAATAGATYLHS
jgi:hypothetical protein